MKPKAIGIDFGTTNTVVALLQEGGMVDAVTFTFDGKATRIFNSALCFWQEGAHQRAEGGPWAIGKYLEGISPIRFIQSFKSFAASAAFKDTRIFRQNFTFEDLLSTFFRMLMKHVPRLSLEGVPVVIGRPVRFWGSRPDEALAMERYRRAFLGLGLGHANYAYEPLGAAYFYARTLDSDATVLVADFGGGTSDFSVMRFTKAGGNMAAEPLGHAGIGIAGDAFDYRIIDQVVSPRLGKGGQYQSMGKRLTIPNRYYANFARWSYLPLMKTSGELRELQSLARDALDAQALRHFIEIIEYDLGFELYRAISDVKVALSASEATTFSFHQGDIEFAERITRQDFESWIAPDVAKIAATVDEALAVPGLGPESVDKVFLTGGSSFIPAIHRMFTERFGEEKLATGSQFESIAYGLALMGGVNR